ncbi:3-[(3aS,4S,7aS)-7a-methyl-1, 5-dioxo-octahydro-1H-inden-4-yl]propanoyl:CoA ligase [Pandoraea fibrosis]|uniref:3-[(3aS,4S,7aS)-7a-methyl-1, 5-dioxo-octahydro-1H-inden-4-yl]propanoyl:CoA ligase n=2 Tax=Pandoraea fibrosis TaxID=1891094 RepID=A0A5E4S4S9_9BURK|nr:3-[(3aS,4S,7aS)-7a-methyl-1, 5-dioxo-octahydro-1H-inden-4-yl]propanoyl:CoA ligase [Pandoraea fibrosis]
MSQAMNREDGSVLSQAAPADVLTTDSIPPLTPAADSVDWTRETFGSALMWIARTHGMREAVVHGETRLTFSELAERICAFARGLIALGVGPGENVALWMSDSTDWLVARWAVPLIGAVLVPVNTRFRESDVAYVLSQSEASTLIVEERAGSVARGIRYFDILARLDPDWDKHRRGAWRCERMPAMRRVIGLSCDRTLPGGMEDFRAVEAHGQRHRHDGVLERRLNQVKPDDVAQILYTSGTTSFPKGAMVRHGALLANNQYAAQCLRLSPSDRYLSCVPLFTATGTFYTLAMALSGAAMVIADQFSPKRFCELVEREKITVSFFVDTIVQDLKAFADIGRYDLSSLRTGTGAPLPTASFEWVSTTLGVPELVSAYGMSETSNAVVRTRWNDPYEKRSRTNGRPVRGVQIRIADINTGVSVPAGVTGEICIAGYVVMKGYYRMPDEDKKAIDAEGWLHTGDLGELDADGYLTYRGRLKEMIKPGGFNVATQEIEVFLKTYPGVRQAVVVGVPDARLGEVGYAYIERQAGAEIDPLALQQYCHAHIASYKVPRYVEFIEDWPLTGSQKIRKLELRDRATQILAAGETAEAGGHAQPAAASEDGGRA